MPVGVNLARYAGRLTNALWFKQGMSAVDLSNTTTSPTGLGTRLTYSASSGVWTIAQSAIPEWNPNTQYTASVWILNESMPSASIAFILGDGAGNGVDGSYNPVTNALSVSDFGTTPVWSSPSGSVTSVGGGWEMISITGVTPPTQLQTLTIGLSGAALSIGQSFLCGGFTLYQGTQTAFVDTNYAPRGDQFLPVFPPLFHRVETRYPDNSAVVQFGKGYSFTSAPQGPPQRTFMVTFDALRTFVNADNSIDLTSFPNFNMGTLEALYQQVQLYQNFSYTHPNLGPMVVRFQKPLVYPRPEPGGMGVQKGVQIELIEIPQ